jgi:hypothetical protein
MARPKDKNSRRSKAARKRLERLLAQRTGPSEYVLGLRKVFSSSNSRP